MADDRRRHGDYYPDGGVERRPEGYDTHILNSGIHVTPEQKARWEAGNTVVDPAEATETGKAADALKVRQSLAGKADKGDVGKFIVVNALPDASAADPKAIYLVPKSPAQTRNVYDEYVRAEPTKGTYAWEKIGDTEIDLSNYATKADATLADRYTDWTCSPAAAEDDDETAFAVMWSQIPDTDVYTWAIGFGGEGDFDPIAYADDYLGIENALSVTFTLPEGFVSGDSVTATRTKAGYQLGTQTDKPLASEAEAEALRQGKQNALSAQQLANIDAVPDKRSKLDLNVYSRGAYGYWTWGGKKFSPVEGRFPSGGVYEWSNPERSTYRLEYNSSQGTLRFVYKNKTADVPSGYDPTDPAYDFGEVAIGSDTFIYTKATTNIVPTGDTLAKKSESVPASRTVNGKALSSDVVLTGADIAVSGSDPTKIDAALAGKASKDDVDPLLFAQYYPDGSVKSAAEFTTGIKYDAPDTVNRTIMAKPFCNTGDSANDNSGLVGRVVIPPFVDATGNGYISDDGTRYKVVGASEGEASSANDNLTAIVAPNTMTTAAYNMFVACTALTSVSLPAAERIGFGTFYYCTSLTYVDFGNTPRSSVPTLGPDAFSGVPTSCKIIVPYTQYDAWIAADDWKDLPQEFVRHAEKAGKPATFTAGNLAELDANGNLADSGIAKTSVVKTPVYDGQNHAFLSATNLVSGEDFASIGIHRWTMPRKGLVYVRLVSGTNSVTGRIGVNVAAGEADVDDAHCVTAFSRFRNETSIVVPLFLNAGDEVCLAISANPLQYVLFSCFYTD